jgi:hypothetical protein
MRIGRAWERITGRKFIFFIATFPAIKLKAFYLNQVCSLTGVGGHFLQFSQLKSSLRDLIVWLVYLNSKSFLIDVFYSSLPIWYNFCYFPFSHQISDTWKWNPFIVNFVIFHLIRVSTYYASFNFFTSK